MTCMYKSDRPHWFFLFVFFFKYGSHHVLALHPRRSLVRISVGNVDPILKMRKITVRDVVWLACCHTA